MSLRLLLPPQGVADLLADWPSEPRVYERGATALDSLVTVRSLHDWIDTGCVPAAEVAVMKAGPSDREAFKTGGRTDPVKLRNLYERGYTIRLGNLQRVIPAFASMSEAIQRETGGYSNYAHAFLTPAGQQGLLHHWDQQMALIVQIAGAKRWELWKPVYEAPMREFQESFRVWQPEFIPAWEAAGPDLTVDLVAGQTLLLPRGWVHNPHALDSGSDSIHLTFAIRERTALWLAEKLVARAIEEREFRRVILPRDLEGAVLADRLGETARALAEFFGGMDMEEMAGRVRDAAVTELEYTT
ncbi:JmjC domain-containing protein [Streptomyces sp. NBC_00996]|uniref:JmjC domain-containing protein n=1 Tax=Streptomyces sp. NBC_00996 TaxID=2903710 RepID=UPI003870B428|nr:cupin domain-containing protein [Streptomyces sp. NBC_00996]